jgi:uncharacterized protein YecT (DUF1311 family)
MRRAVFAIALLFAAAPASLYAAPAHMAGGLPVSKHTLSEKNPVVEIVANYPQTGDPKIDADLLGTIHSIATGFRKEAVAAHDPSEGPYTLAVNFTIARNDAQVFAVVFTDEWDFRGAHPNMEIVTANYFRDGSWRIFLPELFDGPAGLSRISKLATLDLFRRLLGPNALTDREWIARGADAHWSNFAAFVLLPDTLELHFAPYQVAAYAAGPLTAHVPLARLRDVMRANPRAPVASFDCAHIANDDERAICSDVTLARLDRALSDSWTAEYRSEVDPGKKARWKTEQVTWLKKRGTACAAAGPASSEARVRCLSAFYRARLNAIEDEE